MQQENNRPVIVLGRGYVGGMLASFLEAIGRDNFPIARSELDYHDTVRFGTLLDTVKPKSVVIAFGYTGSPNVDECERNPELTRLLNVTVPLQIARMCVDRNIHCVALSSGCVFDGYDKEYAERDLPNNGIFSATSSVYCRSKHSLELALDGLPVSIIRLRMPYCGRLSTRNYLMKLLRYKKILNRVNSKSYMIDVVRYIDVIAQRDRPELTTYHHAVNPNPLPMAELLAMYEEHGLARPDWELVDDIDTVATRSNCVLLSSGFRSLSPFASERECIALSLKRIAYRKRVGNLL